MTQDLRKESPFHGPFAQLSCILYEYNWIDVECYVCWCLELWWVVLPPARWAFDATDRPRESACCATWAEDLWNQGLHHTSAARPHIHQSQSGSCAVSRCKYNLYITLINFNHPELDTISNSSSWADFNFIVYLLLDSWMVVRVVLWCTSNVILYGIACRVIGCNFCVRSMGKSTKCLEILLCLGPMLINHAGITHVNRGLTSRIWFSAWRLRSVTTARSSWRFLLETGCFQTSIDWIIILKIHENTVNKIEEANAGIHVSWNDGFFPKKNWLKMRLHFWCFSTAMGLYPKARPFRDQLRNDVTH